MAAHRGQFQVQGADMNPQLDRPWSQSSPRTQSSGHTDLAQLESGCTQAQLDLRDLAFAHAKRFVNNAHPQGVAAPVSKTFQNRNLPKRLRDARVDIEVHSGLAFI